MSAFTHGFDPKTIDQMKNGELNNLIGGGEPKYAAGKLKSKTKAALQDEAMTMWHEWLTANPAPKNSTRKSRKNTSIDGKPKAEQTGAVQRVSLNRDCAASKKCNLIKALIAGKKDYEAVEKAYLFDTVLQEYWPIDRFKTDIAAAIENGTRPKAAKMVQLQLELD